MIEVDYVVRRIESEDREKHQRDVQRALDRGDEVMARGFEKAFGEWEREQGTQKTVLVCSVCQDPWLTPTRDGRARRHRRSSTGQPTWDQVWRLTRQIQTLQAELERLLRQLEPPD